MIYSNCFMYYDICAYEFLCIFKLFVFGYASKYLILYKPCLSDTVGNVFW